MKAYVAGGFAEWHGVRQIQDALRKRGFEITFDWTPIAERVEIEGRDSVTESLADVAETELAAVDAADVLVVRLPGKAGTHVELGAALNTGMTLIVVAYDGDLPDCVFYHHRLVELVDTTDPSSIADAAERIWHVV